ncbi:MAG: hypothetical protein ABL940_08805 [Bacteroidia bacterium]
MKNIIYTSLLALLLANSAQAQDFITTEKGIEIKAKVIDMTYFAIVYRLFDKQDSGTFTLQKAEVSKITFADGRVESFNKVVKPNDTTVSTTPKTEDLYTRDATSTTNGTIINNSPSATGTNYNDSKMAVQGEQDAELYYTKYKDAACGTGATAVVCGPLLALIPAFTVTKNPIKDENLGYPNRQLMKNEAYSKAYRQTAENKKRKQTWKGYGVGSGVRVGLYIVYLAIVVVLAIMGI